MPKNCKSNREPKKNRIMTMKERRAVEKAKHAETASPIGDRKTTRWVVFGVRRQLWRYAGNRLTARHWSRLRLTP